MRLDLKIEHDEGLKELLCETVRVERSIFVVFKGVLIGSLVVVDFIKDIKLSKRNLIRAV